MSDSPQIRTIEELARFVLAFWDIHLAEKGIRLEGFIQRLASEIEIQNMERDDK